MAKHELITHIPENLTAPVAMSGGLEPVTTGYPNFNDYPDSDSSEYERALLTRLRGEVAFNPDREALLANAYGVARNVADIAISQHGANGTEAFSVMHEARYYSRPRKWSINETENLGSHDRRSNTLAVNHDAILKAGHAHNRTQIENAISLRHEGDSQLLSFLSTFGHEVGHTVLAGNSSLLESMGYERNDSRLTSSAKYMTMHPEQGFTGNLTNDTWIHEERFAEGYGRLVVSRAMEVLGYTSDEVAQVMDAIHMQPDVTGPAGQNQVDYVRNVNFGASIGVQIASSHPEAHRNQVYEGALGYALPLTLDEIVNQLAEMCEVCKAETIKEVAHEDYGVAEAARDPKVEAYVQELEKARAEYKNGKQVSPEEAVQPRHTRIAKAVGKKTLARFLKRQ